MDESRETPHIEVEDIDHLGIVAGIIDEIGLVEEVDHKLGTHSQQYISSGQVLEGHDPQWSWLCLRSSVPVRGVL